MSASHAPKPRLAPRVVVFGRELVVLVFAGGVTYLATRYITVDWGPLPCDSPGVGAMVAAAAVLPAAIRHRFPLTALLAAAFLFGWYPATGVTLALASYSVAGRVRSARRRSAGLVLAALTPFVVGLVESGYQWEISFADFGIAALVCVVGPAVVQVLLGQRERLIDALREQTSYAASAARLQERSRIAQEMHDLLGHRLSLISLYAGSLELDTAKPAHVTEPARLIRSTVRTAMQELRATLGILRQQEPVATQPVDHTGTWQDVAQLVRQAQAGGVEVDLTWSGPDLAGVALPIRQAVHRIVREGLTNVCTHAGDAKAEVLVEHRSGRVRVSVFDDGRGGGTPGSGLGLVGVQERVRLLGGSFQAEPLSGRGFRLTVELPLSIAPPASVEPVPESGMSAKADGRWARAGMSAVLATGLIGAVAILVVTFTMVSFDQPGSVTVSYDSIAIGSTRDQVAGFIGQDEPIAHQAARGHEPHRPSSADCWYSYSLTEDGLTMIERYCFRQDLLVDKAKFALPA